MSAADYYVLIGNEEQGPFALEQLRTMLLNGEINSTTLAAAPGFKDWIEVQHLLNVHAPAPRWKKKMDAGAKSPGWGAGAAAGLVLVLILVAIASAGGDGFAWVALLVLSVGGLGIYFLPTILAAIGKNRNVIAIGVLNLLLGWTILGWVAAIVWALYVEKKS
jgi:hypothetical protein